jgi:hypothetical protein
VQSHSKHFGVGSSAQVLFLFPLVRDAHVRFKAIDLL